MSSFDPTLFSTQLATQLSITKTYIEVLELTPSQSNVAVLVAIKTTTNLMYTQVFDQLVNAIETKTLITGYNMVSSSMVTGECTQYLVS